MPEFESLANHFLIAMPGLADPNFSRTVTYICEHTPEGAMGLIINRPLDLSMAEIFEELEIRPDTDIDTRSPVFQGGPVQHNRGFVLHEPPGDWDSSMRITDSLAISTSKDIMEAMAHNRGPRRNMLALGYAGWGPGQLEQEMAANAWLSGPADNQIIFELPVSERWHAAAKLLGVEIEMLSDQAGHA
ncbi:MAG: YqgE/AlgH family protein [Gammaproteobacteria bacterium]|nr:YqgE/AlgH family protein [Gammaproteobacteria bacterium]